MPDAAPAESPRCRAVKRGGTDLTCELDDGHQGWHRAVFERHEDITYQGAHHVIDMRESVTWEPVDHVAEAVKHIMKGRPRD